jgi:hypothetical protein
MSNDDDTDLRLTGCHLSSTMPASYQVTIEKGKHHERRSAANPASH